MRRGTVNGSPIRGETSVRFSHIMTTPTCAKCGRVIPAGDVNVANDVAYCRACNLSHALSDLTHGVEPEANPDLGHPPAGAWYRGSGRETVIGATHFAPGAAVGLLLFSLFWNGIVSVFVFFAVSATWQKAGLAAPDWFPEPKMNGGPISNGMLIFLWLFLTPFILIGLGMIAAFLSCLAGRTEARLDDSRGVIFTGVAGVGYRQRFLTHDVTRVRLEATRSRGDDSASGQTRIVLDLREGKSIKFGSSLTEARRRFVAAALRKKLLG